MINITKAAKEIAYDNGAINRTTTEEKVLQRMLGSVVSFYSPADLEIVESFLGSLSEADLETLCVGEHGVIPAPQLVHDVLEMMFNNM